MKHVRILKRLVLSLSYREDHHLVRFAQVEGCGTNEIAYIFNEDDSVVVRIQTFKSVILLKSGVT